MLKYKILVHRKGITCRMGWSVMVNYIHFVLAKPWVFMGNLLHAQHNCLHKEEHRGPVSRGGRVVILLLRTPARVLPGLLDCRDTRRREPLNDQALSPGG